MKNKKSVAKQLYDKIVDVELYKLVMKDCIPEYNKLQSKITKRDNSQKIALKEGALSFKQILDIDYAARNNLRVEFNVDEYLKNKDSNVIDIIIKKFKYLESKTDYNFKSGIQACIDIIECVVSNKETDNLITELVEIHG